MSSILIGFADCSINSNEDVQWNCNKIGGYPEWLTDTNIPMCKKCQSIMMLVVQIYCPLDYSEYHRTLHVFCCKNPPCWTTNEGWTALRTQAPESKFAMEKPEAKAEFSQDLWDHDSDWGTNDWGTNEPDVVNSMQGLKLKEKCEANGGKVDKSKYDHGYFEPHYINVLDENDIANEESHIDEHIKQLVETYKDTEDDLSHFSGKVNVKAEEYEKAEKNLFDDFCSRVKKFPQQVIRYQHDGKPLLVKETNSNIPCKNCNKKRIFEMQLMPALLPHLALKEIDCPIEFGTVLIYTCANNCYSVAPLEEEIIYQPDPYLLYFKGQNKT